MTKEKDLEQEIKFRFAEFNPRRALRNAPAAKVYIDEGEGEYWLWMNRTDLKKNMVVFGKHPELLKALQAYGKL